LQLERSTQQHTLTASTSSGSIDYGLSWRPVACLCMLACPVLYKQELRAQVLVHGVACRGPRLPLVRSPLAGQIGEGLALGAVEPVHRVVGLLGHRHLPDLLLVLEADLRGGPASPVNCQPHGPR